MARIQSHGLLSALSNKRYVTVDQVYKALHPKAKITKAALDKTEAELQSLERAKAVVHRISRSHKANKYRLAK